MQPVVGELAQPNALTGWTKPLRERVSRNSGQLGASKESSRTKQGHKRHLL